MVGDQVPTWMSVILASLGVGIAVISLVVAWYSAVRQANAEKRQIRAKLGVKFIGVRRDVTFGEEEQRQIFQVRLAAAEGFVVTKAGLSFRSKLRLGRWVHVEQQGCGFVKEGDRRIEDWLPRVVDAGKHERLAIPAVQPSVIFWARHHKRKRRVKCWVEVGNYWTVRTGPVVIVNLTKSYDPGHF